MSEPAPTTAAPGPLVGAPEWEAEIPVSHSVTLPPDPHVMEAIGGNHRLETAVADLVDNSIDAEASSASCWSTIVFVPST